MKRPFTATVWREGDWYVSQCLEIDIASQGETEEEALDNLKEALELHFEIAEPRACQLHGRGRSSLSGNPGSSAFIGVYRRPILIYAIEPFGAASAQGYWPPMNTDEHGSLDSLIGSAGRLLRVPNH